ncbi:MAG: AMP-binding protein, partial [Chloroflexota bacterium]
MHSINAAELLRRAAERQPGKTAIIWEDGQLSYAELLRRVDRLSQALATLRVGKGDRVAILFHNGPRFIESWWASVQLGAIAVPLSTRALPAELRATIDDAQAAAVLAGGEFLPAIAERRREMPSVRTVIGDAGQPPAGVFPY